DTLGVPEIRQNDLFSWRLLHAKVMEELATTPPRVLAYDIAFATPREEFDERFAESARKLRAAGCKVILGMFSIDPSGEPKVAPVLRQAVDACGWLWSAGPEGSARAAVLTIE